MTRINSVIPVQSLTDEHLLAEHREIKRLPSVLRKCKTLNRIPKEFCLGTGHVLFFMDKFRFTFNRFCQIHQECLKRGFQVEDYSDNWSGIAIELFNDYEPSEYERKLLVERISDRLKNSSKKSFHYYGKPVDIQESILLLSKF